MRDCIERSICLYLKPERGRAAIVVSGICSERSAASFYVAPNYKVCASSMKGVHSGCVLIWF